jgi:hypothetical protein
MVGIPLAGYGLPLLPRPGRRVAEPITRPCEARRVGSASLVLFSATVREMHAHEVHQHEEHHGYGHNISEHMLRLNAAARRSPRPFDRKVQPEVESVRAVTNRPQLRDWAS